jgi:iron complex transport system substrate-binding protein
VIGREGEPSFSMDWQDVLSARPEIVVLMSCGYNLERNINVWRSTKPPAGWHQIPAVQNDRIYAVDANSYFSRPGPRLSEGVALLATILHPTRLGAHNTRHGESVRHIQSQSPGEKPPATESSRSLNFES